MTINRIIAASCHTFQLLQEEVPAYGCSSKDLLRKQFPYLNLPEILSIIHLSWPIATYLPRLTIYHDGYHHIYGITDIVPNKRRGEVTFQGLF
jgi:hypothetical protein